MSVGPPRSMSRKPEYFCGDMRDLFNVFADEKKPSLEGFLFGVLWVISSKLPPVFCPF